MPRNRLLFNSLATFIGLGLTIVLMFAIQADSSADSPLAISGFLGGAFILGFLAYKNDGIKISLIISIVVAVIGIILGIMIMTDVSTWFSNPDNVGGLIFGLTFGVLGVFGGVLIIIMFVVGAALFFISGIIGSLIGNLVWQDKQKELEASGRAYQPIIQPEQQTYQPTQVAQPVKQVNTIVCPNCGATNKTTDNFCISCGQKI